MTTLHNDEDDEMWCNDVPCYFDGGSDNDGDLDQWEYLLRTFDTLPEEAPTQTPALNGAAAVAHSYVAAAALPKSNSSPQTVVVEQVDGLWDESPQPNAVFGAAMHDSCISTDGSKSNTEFWPRDLRNKHVLTSDLIQLRSVAAPCEASHKSTSSSGGLNSLYSGTTPTLDSISTPNLLFPDAVHYVFTPRIAEMLQSNGWSSSANLETSNVSRLETHRNGGCHDSIHESGNQSPKSLRRSVPVKACQQRSYQRPPSKQSRVSNASAKVCLPLTAYNYFYRHERDTIVNGMTHPNDPLPPSVWDFTAAKKAELLHQHWYVVLNWTILCSRNFLWSYCTLTTQVFLSLALEQECGSIQEKAPASKDTWYH
jgi:hypothetical protein